MSTRGFQMSALALAGCLVAAPAWAGTGTASLSNVHVRIVDLDPLDGITASATFLSGTMLSSLFYDATGGAPVYLNNSGALGGSAPYQLTGPGTSASSQWLAGDLFTGAGPGAVASASAVGADHRAQANSQGSEIKFSVTPNTLLIVTADAPTAALSLILGESGFATAAVALRSADNSFSAESQAYVYRSPDGSALSITPTSLQTSFVNLTAAPTEVFLNFYASAYVTSIAAAVPEPASAGLALLGLAAIGGAVRRRRA